jgi:hypothetical protein
MKIGNIVGVYDEGVWGVGCDFAARRARTGESFAAANGVNEANKAENDALQKVEEARESNDRTTLQMMDRHNEMVEKSRKLYKAKAERQAIERRNQKHREEQREILAEIALRNAERRDLLEAARLKG